MERNIIININSIKLQQKLKKINLILNIFLEKQFFLFIYLYLIFLQRISITFTSNQFFNIFSSFLIKFCNIFHFSLLVNKLNISNRIIFINHTQIAILKTIIKKKNK